MSAKVNFAVIGRQQERAFQRLPPTSLWVKPSLCQLNNIKRGFAVCSTTLYFPIPMLLFCLESWYSWLTWSAIFQFYRFVDAVIWSTEEERICGYHENQCHPWIFVQWDFAVCYIYVYSGLLFLQWGNTGYLLISLCSSLVLKN